MKTMSLILVTLFATSSAFAAKFGTLKTLTDPALQSAYETVQKETNYYSTILKVVKPTPAKGHAPTYVRANTIAQAAHTMCPFFDEGVDIGWNTVVKEAVQTIGADRDVEAKLVKSFSAAGSKVEFYSGTASGNNTYGEILGAYDVENDEIVVFANTNCGSDD